MPLDPRKRMVRDGYDAAAKRYAAWVSQNMTGERSKYTSVLLDGLPQGEKVLDLGCGAGEPTTRQLAEKFHVTGVDISAKNIELARLAAPGASFLQADMTELNFQDGSFDGVAAFYSIIHVPHEEQGELAGRIARWLKSGGLFVASFSAFGGGDSYENDWLGVTMYWSGLDREANVRLVEDAGLVVEQANLETQEEFGEATTFLWIVARKP